MRRMKVLSDQCEKSSEGGGGKRKGRRGEGHRFERGFEKGEGGEGEGWLGVL